MFIYLLYILLFPTLSRTDELTIQDTGIGFFDDDDIAMIFYITLENTCDRDFEVSVFMEKCCDTMNPNQTDCTSMSLIGGDMGTLNSKSTKNVTLIYPNLYLRNRRGQCMVDIHYQNEGVMRQKMSKIDFNTVVVSKNEDACECASVDMDPTQNCKPLDCVVKYSGMRNYFDPKLMACACVTKCISPPDLCVPELAYDIRHNNCTNLNTTIGKEDLQLLDSNTLMASECFNCPLGNTVCHHGVTDSGQCECDTGWTTTTDDEIYSPSLLPHHMCNIEVGAWNCLNKGKIRTTSVLIAIFAITIVSKILIVMCILNWCYKRYRENKEKICSDKLDPRREEIIMCEDLKQFQECVCEESSKKKKSHFLETQTVNVSYYPCMPNLSSLRGSSMSENCSKCSKYPNSEASIMLSKTTTSSAAVESESEAATETSEQACQRNYVHFSEEGECSDSDEEEDVREEELYGEGGKSDVDGEDMLEECGEQSDYTGRFRSASFRTSSSKSKSASSLQKSKSSVNTK